MQIKTILKNIVATLSLVSCLSAMDEIVKDAQPLTVARTIVTDAREETDWVSRLQYVLDNGLFQTKMISHTGPKDAPPIKVYFAEDKPLARAYNPERLKLTRGVAQELGLLEHLAPFAVINGKGYEKFVTLFSDTQSEELLACDVTAQKLSSYCGENGDLTVLRIILSPDKELLDSIDSDSVDELFLHHIITSASDAVSRNFLLQYKEFKLRLVRIDYNDSIMSESYDFLGAQLNARFHVFGPKGRQLINRLSGVVLEKESWDEDKRLCFDHPSFLRLPVDQKKLYEEKVEQRYLKYTDRIRALRIMNEEGFFEIATRVDTMIALSYIGLCDALHQKVCFSTQNFVNIRERKDITSSFAAWLDKICRCCYMDKYYENVRNFFDEDIVRLAVKEWMQSPDKMNLIGIRVFQPILNSSASEVDLETYDFYESFAEQFKNLTF